MQLPPPIMEQTPAGANQSEPAPSGAEQTPSVPEKAAAPSPPSAGAPLMVPPNALPSLPTAPASATATSVQDNSAPTVTTNYLQVTDDADLIEKEWVNKAKQIVDQTRDDPYKQTEELTVFKADYMQKRYGKTIKLNQ